MINLRNLKSIKRTCTTFVELFESDFPEKKDYYDGKRVKGSVTFSALW